MRQKVFSILAFLLMAATGAMAQDAVAITTDLADSYDAKVGSPITLSIEASNVQYYQWYKKLPQGNATIMFATSSSYTFTPKEAGEIKFFCRVIGYNNDLAESKVTTVIATVPPTYNVTMADGTEDAANWTISPASAAENETVTIKYNGTKKVKSVKAVKKAATDLSTITANYTAQDGETLTGTLANNVKISIADGATVTLKDVNINGSGSWGSGNYAGLTPEGDATIILEGANTVKGFYEEYPGIYVPVDKMLTIKGTGTLNASSNGYGAGIGCGFEITCGNIVINGGNITATGGLQAAGIGGSDNGTCGTITINGGTVTATGGAEAAGIGGGYQGTCGAIYISGGTITAKGGYGAAGIGGGRENKACGTITITSGVTKVEVTKGEDAPCSIGKGLGGTDITVTIGGTVYASGISQSPYEYPLPTLNITSPAVNQVIGSDGKNYAADATLPTGVTAVAMIAYVSGSHGLAIALADEGSMDWETAVSTAAAHTPAFTGGTWKLPSRDDWKQMFSANGGSEDSCSGLNTALATAGGDGSKLLEIGIYWSSTPYDENNAWRVDLNYGNGEWDYGSVGIGRRVRACLAF